MIMTYEAWVGYPAVPGAVDFIAFVGEHWMKDQHIPLPDLRGKNGSVSAYVNQGRWVVQCPNRSCGGALVVSKEQRVFICHACGSPENGVQWYNVTFPPSLAVVERLLLLRPSPDPLHAPHRNWDPGESLDDLRRQNREHDLRDS